MDNKKIKYNKELAECVGLWLAEGDNKSRHEITFSNNCWELVDLFHKTISKLFRKYNLKIRIYVYNSIKKQIKIPIKDVQINYYVDKRATKPYYIWRLASVDLVKKWKDIVEKSKNKKEMYAGVLRGFFAGEGNIKEGSHSNRTVRISQNNPNRFIEGVLDYYKVEYKFVKNERNYYITHKQNWNKLAKIRIADLHPTKKTRFLKVYNDFKEEHYKHNYLKKKIIESLVKPYTSKQLSTKFNRSQARIYDVLYILKKEWEISNFRVKSKDYWIRNDQKVIIVSKIKQKYLNLLKESNKTTEEISSKLKICWKSAFRRLKELEKLRLVKRGKNKIWEVIHVNKKVVVI